MALPALEELQTAWEKKCDSPKFELYKNALTDSLEKLNKYYLCLDQKPSFVLGLGRRNSFYYFSDLHTDEPTSTSPLL